MLLTPETRRSKSTRAWSFHSVALRLILATFSVLTLAISDGALAASITLGWTPPTNTAGIGGYQVHYGVKSGQTNDATTGAYWNVSAASTARTDIANLAAGSTYYFAVRSCSQVPSSAIACQPSSAYANEISAKIPGTDATSPTVSSMAASAANPYTAAQNVTISVNATDNVGIQKVEFYDNNKLVGTDTSSPFSVTWSVTNAVNGAHTWTAWAYDAAGNIGKSVAGTQAELTLTVNIPVVPVASFTASGSAASSITVAPGQLITFLCTSTGTVASRSWSLGDNTSATAATVVKSYANSGTTTIAKTVTLSVTGAGTTKTATKTVYVTKSTGTGTGTGQLSPVLTTPSGAANLTTEGTADWVHWGLTNAASINRKSGVTAQIGKLTMVNGAVAARYADNSLQFTWSNGTATANATTRTGLYVPGINKGYELTVPADTNGRTLVVYLGGWNTRGRIEVSLSDGSAAAYAATVEGYDPNVGFVRRLALNYRAASANQTLKVRYLQDVASGNVTFQAATLQATSAATSAATLQATDAADVAIELGEVQVNEQWQRVNFKTPFADPIVVAKPLSGNDSDPAVVRVKGVDATGFWIRVQEWDYQDGIHGSERLSYMVTERGRHQLPDGAWVEAGRLTTGATNTFVSQTFSEPLYEIPVVFATVTSANEAAAVATRLRTITVKGFEVGMQEQESNAQQHLAESIDYIAWEPSFGVVNGMRYEVGLMDTGLTDTPQTLLYPGVHSQTPFLIADMQSTNGTEPATLRWRNRNEVSVDLWVAEEQSKDLEIAHSAESVGYWLADKDL